MKYLTPAVFTALSLGLFACTPPAEAPADAAAPAAPAESPAPAAPEAPAATPAAYAPTEALLANDGLTFPNPGGRGTGLNVNFGQPRFEVIEALTGFRGAAPTLSLNSECGAGPLTFANWGDGLQLLFQNGVFSGWAAGSQTPRGFTTGAGIGIGSTVARLRAAHPGVRLMTDTLGPEFGVDDVYGIASGTGPTATITHLWAGLSCNFR